MKAVAILIHGYNVADPGETTGKLRRHFESLGVLVEEFTYGFWPFTWQVSEGNFKEAKLLSERCLYWKMKGYKVIVAGHSNGVCITHLATKYHDAAIDVCVAINPALQVRINPAPKANAVHVWHNEGDKAVKWAVWLRKIFKGVRARPWGEMGAVGYKGVDTNVTSFDAGNDFVAMQAHGHSDMFSEAKEDFFLSTSANLAFNAIQESE